MTDSLLGDLVGIREKLIADQARVIPLPIWGENNGSPKISLKVLPVDGESMARIQQRAENAGKRDPKRKAMADIDALASIIATATQGVIIGGLDGDVRDDGKDRELDLRDPSLVSTLGLYEGCPSGEIIKALMIRPGDLTAVCSRVMEISGFTESIEFYEELEGK